MLSKSSFYIIRQPHVQIFSLNAGNDINVIHNLSSAPACRQAGLPIPPGGHYTLQPIDFADYFYYTQLITNGKLALQGPVLAGPFLFVGKFAL